MDEHRFEVHNFKEDLDEEVIDLPKPHKVLKFFGFIFKFFAYSFLVLSFSVIAISYIYYLKIKGDFTTLKPRVNATQITIYDKEGQIIYESYGSKTPERVNLKDLPEVVKQSTLAAEDLDFYKHDAYDIKGIFRAVFENYKKSGNLSVLFDESSYSQGGSTITQQLVKNRYLTNERSFGRKIREIVYASELEKKYSKDEILEAYLNEIYYGEQALGIENAAKIYFGKKAKDLTLAEASMLAGLPQAPTKFSPVTGDFLESKKRQEYVLQRMLAANYIELDKAKEAANEFLTFSGKKQFISKYPFFTDWVMSELAATFGKEFTDKGGVSVYTSLDPKIQDISEKSVSKNLLTFKTRNVGNAAAVVLDPKTGEIKAMVGGKDYNESKVNVATSFRQPGSSFKPIVYATGLEEGYTANTKFIDKYVNFGGNPGYAPRNFDGGYRGYVTMRKSLSWSLNIPAVEMLSLVGLDKVISQSEKFGVNIGEEAKKCGLALALGCKEVRLLDMVSAYAVFGDEGNYKKPTAIKKLVDNRGETIYEPKTKMKQAISKENAYIITNILSDINTRRTVFGFRNKLELDRPAAAKTGTTDNYTDSWTIGFTPDLVCGVWMGNNDRKPMQQVPGIEGAAFIWNDIMSQSLKDTPKSEFKRPESVIEARINPQTGVIATSGGIVEIFKKGTEPKGAKEDLSYLNRFK